MSDAEPEDYWSDDDDGLDHHDDEPSLDESETAPESLSGTAIDVWHRLIGLARACGWKATDRFILERYAYLLGRYWDDAAIIAKEGLTYEVEASVQHKKLRRGRGGKSTTATKDVQVRTLKKRHPAAVDQDKLLPEIRQHEDRLGLNKKSRLEMVLKGLKATVNPGLFDGHSRSSPEGHQRPDPTSFN